MKTTLRGKDQFSKELEVVDKDQTGELRSSWDMCPPHTHIKTLQANRVIIAGVPSVLASLGQMEDP